MSNKPKEKIVRMTLDEIKQSHNRGDYGKTDWKRLDAMTDEEIEEAIQSDPDAAPIVDENFWKNATVVIPENQQLIALRIDPEVLEWFKSQGSGYLTRMNAVLRSYMEAHRKI